MGIFAKLKASLQGRDDADRYLKGLDKSKKTFGDRLRRLANGFRGVDDEFLEEVMIILLEADVGIHTAEKITARLESEAARQRLKTFDEISECLVSVMLEMYQEHTDAEVQVNEDGTTVILLVGVNGSGKTTTAAKLTRAFQEEGKSVVLAAADTFRAGAVDQLARWGERLGAPCIKGKENGDPSAVLVDACRYARAHECDYLIGDTAGRLQNKVNLMNELTKMRRVIGREIPDAPHEVWLVLDATTGQNGIQQAKVFLEATAVSGIILTKMDGTAKGGIVLAIRDQLGLPVRYIGLGEHPEDLRPFDIESYLYGICEGMSPHA